MTDREIELLTLSKLQDMDKRAVYSEDGARTVDGKPYQEAVKEVDKDMCHLILLDYAKSVREQLVNH